ncbi:MAG: DUF4831 family protein [Bacteroidales bacterium]
MKFKFLTYSTIGVLMALFFSLGCKTEQQATTRVYKVDTANSQKIQSGLVYGLPKTQLTFHVNMKRNVVVPGPYHEYGEKLLGLSNVPHNEKIQWDIEDIDIKETSVIDYDHLYAVEPRGRLKIDWSKFTREGWIIPLDRAEKEKEISDFYSEKDYGNDLLYKDLSVRKFMGEETKTVYERVWKDSLFARVPVEKTETVQKDKPAKAREAANFIFMIREKRFELISGMGDYYPDGKALETAINEMNRLESKYLDLFTGKRITDSLQFTLKMTPDSIKPEEPTMLFRFSEEDGILQPGQNEGTPVWLELSLSEDIEKIRSALQDRFTTSQDPAFHYRVPVNGELRLKYGEKLMAKKYLQLHQFGPVIQIPQNFLMDSKIIDFFPEKLKD